MVSVATPVLGSVSAECAADLAEGSRWRAIAVFGSAAYLCCDQRHDAVVALARPDALQLPNSVRIGAGDDLREVLQPGDEGLVRAGSLRIGALDVRLAGRHRPAGVRPQPGHAVHPDDLAALQAKPGLRSRARAVAAALDAGEPDALADVVGWGRGLTPAGDDLVCGVLLAFVGAGHWAAGAAGDLVARHGLRTTSLSARMLSCAARGLAVPAVVDLVDALLAPDRRPDRQQFAAVHAIGHSSGRDLCAGLAGAIDHLHGREQR